MGVKRFDFCGDEYSREGWMEEASLGQYVLASDYDALAADNADNVRRMADDANKLHAAYTRIAALEAALRWALRRVLTRDNAEEVLFMEYRALANYPAETPEKHSTEDDFQHFLSYSGLGASYQRLGRDVIDLRVAYYTGAGIDVTEPCSACAGTGEIDETLGGISTSDPHAPCPDCTPKTDGK